MTRPIFTPTAALADPDHTVRTIFEQQRELSAGPGQQHRHRSAAQLEDRYGPQPGDGKPPASS